MKKNLVFSIIFTTLLFCCVSCNKQDENYLFLVCENGQFGYINQNGKMIIKPNYNRAEDFSEGLAAVYDSGGYGFIDAKGKVVIPFQFSRVLGPFQGGIAPIITQDGKKAYVNRKGNIFAQGISNISHHPDSDGLLKYEKEKKLGFIDTNGNVVIKPQFDDVSEFSEGLAAVKLKNKWGFINKSGELVIECKYEEVNDFKEGLAPIKLSDQWGFIDKTGKTVIKAQYHHASCFSDGLACVTEKSKTNGYIDKKGNLVIDCKYGLGMPFKEGLAQVRGNGKGGIVDKNGKTIVKLEYDRIEPFSEGLAVVQKGTKFGYIDKDGNTVIPLKYEKAYDFKDGLALVYISKSEQLEPEVKHVGDMIVVMFNDPEKWSDGIWGYIDKNDKMLYSSQCEKTGHMFPTVTAKEGSDGSVRLGADGPLKNKGSISNFIVEGPASCQ